MTPFGHARRLLLDAAVLLATVLVVTSPSCLWPSCPPFAARGPRPVAGAYPPSPAPSEPATSSGRCSNQSRTARS